MVMPEDDPANWHHYLRCFHHVLRSSSGIHRFVVKIYI